MSRLAAGHCEQPDEKSQLLAAWRRAGQRIALVPPMGGLHRGCLSLVEIARSLGEAFGACVAAVKTRRFPAQEAR